jgi:hypothetical protein
LGRNERRERKGDRNEKEKGGTKGRERGVTYITGQVRRTRIHHIISDDESHKGQQNQNIPNHPRGKNLVVDTSLGI